MSRPRIVTALVALSAPTILAASMSAGSASAADQARITVSSHQVRVGQVIEFTATGLDTHGGYYVMLCQNQPAVLPVCARPREVPDSFRHISNESTTALPIRPDGTATGKLRIATNDTSVFGPLPNDTHVNCAFGGCSIALVEDHSHAKALGGMLPAVVAATPVTLH